MSALITDVYELLVDARPVVLPHQVAELDIAIERLSEPLRVAIAGKVKAGKSTLLNALVGDQLAPTDAGECTRVVTWYEDGVTYQVSADLVSGTTTQIPFDRVDGAIQPRLGTLSADDIDRLTVTWPAEPLRTMTLIDTPGIDSISVDVSARSHRFLAPDSDRATDADAVLYLLRHLHPNDMRFLDAFHDDDVAQGTPTNAIGILARADEIGSCAVDALDIARQAAEGYSDDPKLRSLCQTVVPVAGLVAQGGASLRQADYDDLVLLSGLAAPELDQLLLTAERFALRSSVVDADRRADLLSRLGLYGVRLSIDLINAGRAATASALAAELVSHSGIAELRHLLVTRFMARSQVLKARSALAVLRSALAPGQGQPGHDVLLQRIDQLQLHAHEFREVVLLSRLRSGAIATNASARSLLGGPILPEIEQVLGGRGIAPHQRLGLAPETTADVLADAARQMHGRLTELASHPFMTGGASEVVGGALRSVEGLLVTLGASGAGASG